MARIYFFLGALFIFTASILVWNIDSYVPILGMTRFSLYSLAAFFFGMSVYLVLLVFHGAILRRHFDLWGWIWILGGSELVAGSIILLGSGEADYRTSVYALIGLLLVMSFLFYGIAHERSDHSSK